MFVSKFERLIGDHSCTLVADEECLTGVFNCSMLIFRSMALFTSLSPSGAPSARTLTEIGCLCE